MNNRRNLKENLTISNKQRFSIRKFSIGVASVMLGTTLYFMGGVGTSIVHADSVQGQSVQTSNLDTNSAQASSDTSSAEQTSSQNQTSSAQNSQKAVSNASSNTESTDSKTQTSDQVDNATTDKNEASQADDASATNIKTRDNKKVVSDANRAKSTANDAQTKPAQQTAKSDAANSNTLVVQRTKKLTVNAKLLADSKAQTDTKTDSNYSVTDNYPEGLMNYLPRNFNNTQEYAFEWLQNENKNNIILTTNRTGDGEVYVYLDGKKVGTLATNSSQTLDVTRRDIWGHDHSREIGTVYNDDYAGIVQSNNGYLLNIIYSSHAKDVDNAGSSYSTVSFFVPRKIKQTVTYMDSKGNVIDSLTHTQYGLTGQSYTTGLPSGSDYVRKGEYLVNTTHNGSGLMSEFHDTYSCTKDYHDGVKVTFTEHDSDGIGAMDYVIYDGGWVAQWGSLADGQSTNYTNDSGIYTIVNPYVPQTTNIVYQYEPLGNVVKTVPGPEGTTTTTTTQYKNDPNDPTKVKSINVPSIPGYTTLVNGKTIMPADPGKDTTITIMPADPGKDTTITYSANDQSTTAKFVDDDNNGAQVGDTVTLNGKTDQTINTGLKVPDNYELAKDQTLPETYKFKANGNDPIVIHLVHATKPDTNDNNLNKTVTRTINVINPDGNTNTITQVAHLRRSGTIDEVTQKATYTPWITDNWAEYDTPQISGYTPSPAKVLATKVDGNTQNQTVTITYSANDQSTTAKFVDDDNNGAQVGDTVTLNGKTDQ
ncbi:mucin-binding protein, partial [Lactobacillus amylovorus]|uniref:mucin-binding protein n=1 Tax=Lactobacillus amylovorus TaxID=1604 RepID=UPI003F97BAC3